MVRDTAVATRTALADTGRATLSMLDVDGGGGAAPQVTLSNSRVTTSGTSRPTVATTTASSSATTTSRASTTATPRSRTACSATTASPLPPDPRDLAGALTPDAEYQVVGEQVVGEEVVDGVRTTHLRAGNPAVVSAEVDGRFASHTSATTSTSPPHPVRGRDLLRLPSPQPMVCSPLHRRVRRRSFTPPPQDRLI
jgi:hypothetical protein